MVDDGRKAFQIDDVVMEKPPSAFVGNGSWVVTFHRMLEDVGRFLFAASRDNPRDALLWHALLQIVWYSQNQMDELYIVHHSKIYIYISGLEI